MYSRRSLDFVDRRRSLDSVENRKIWKDAWILWITEEASILENLGRSFGKSLDSIYNKRSLDCVDKRKCLGRSLDSVNYKRSINSVVIKNLSLRRSFDYWITEAASILQVTGKAQKEARIQQIIGEIQEEALKEFWILCISKESWILWIVEERSILQIT